LSKNLGIEFFWWDPVPSGFSFAKYKKINKKISLGSTNISFAKYKKINKKISLGSTNISFATILPN
jgi:hypothetical protein